MRSSERTVMNDVEGESEGEGEGEDDDEDAADDLKLILAQKAQKQQQAEDDKAIIKSPRADKRMIEDTKKHRRANSQEDMRMRPPCG